MATTFKPKPWEEVKDIVAGKESYDYDTIAYDRLEKDGSKKNLAGIVTPKPISQMTIGELNDWQEAEMRNKSRAYGLNIADRQAELRRQGFKDDPGSTGVGRYQFEKSTLVDTAKELYGDNYRNVKFDPDTQEKLASHLYYKAAARGPEALGNTWHALRDIDTGSGPATTRMAIASKSSSTSILPAAATVAAGGLAGVFADRSGGAESESDDIGTLGQYRGKYNLYSAQNAKNRLRAALLAKRMKERNKPKTVAENTVRFKDFRKKIYEQIIMNEEKENQE